MGLLFIAVLVAIYVVLLWAALVYAWRLGLKEWRATKSKDARRFKATVVDKRQVGTASHSAEDLIVEYYVTFEFCRSQKELLVDESTYQRVHVGETGVLVLAGEKYQSFNVDNPDDEQDAIFRRILRR